jgi:hypothetical protein
VNAAGVSNKPATLALQEKQDELRGVLFFWLTQAALFEQVILRAVQYESFNNTESYRAVIMTALLCHNCRNV